MKHIPHNTRIFIGLSIITLLLTYLAVSLSDYNKNFYLSRSVTPKAHIEKQATLVDTADWQKYQDSTYPISFMLPENWTAKSDETKDFYIIDLDVPNESANIRIYINPTNYYGLEGLISKPYTIGKVQGSTIDGGLFGVKAGEYYYTFDGTMNPDQIDEFTALVNSVRFQ